MPSENSLDKLIAKIGGAVDQYSLASEILEQLGGHIGLADLICKGLKASKPGTAAYSQLLRAVLELFGRVSKDMGNKRGEEEVSDNELEAAIADAKRKVKRVRPPKSGSDSTGDREGAPGGNDQSVADWSDVPGA